MFAIGGEAIMVDKRNAEYSLMWLYETLKD